MGNFLYTKCPDILQPTDCPGHHADCLYYSIPVNSILPDVPQHQYQDALLYHRLDVFFQLAFLPDTPIKSNTAHTNYKIHVALVPAECLAYTRTLYSTEWYRHKYIPHHPAAYPYKHKRPFSRIAFLLCE